MGAALLLTLPELILSLTSLALLMVAAYAGDRSVRMVSILSVAALVAAAFAALLPPTGYGIAFGGLYRADAFSAFAKLLIYVAAGVSIVIAPAFFHRAPGQGGTLRAEYPILILLSTIGTGMMVSAGDMLTLYVGLELQSLASYVLASFMRRDLRSAESGLKYFVLGALASGILLYGISLVYGFTGTTQYDGIAVAFREGLSTGQLFGLVFVFAGLAFKIAAVPFHMWTPDVYEGAPTPVTAFFATAQKVGAVALLLRVAVEAMGSASDAWMQIVIFSALASTILGGVAAIGQSNIKRLLAYSSINNVGFALFGLVPGDANGVSSVLTYLAVYIVMTLGSFLCILRMRDAEGRPVEEISALSGLSRLRPGLAAALAIFMFSLAGIPPLFGFWPKFLVFDALVAIGMWPLAMVGIATSVIGAYYYLKIVKTMYFDEPATPFGASPDRVEGGLIAVGALIVSPLGYLLIGPLGAYSLAAARALFPG
ncbi:NADH-quinone oxidoreductase subunit NuoN [Sphingomonas jatrophae]|uniref:NADH-quinone oxidoreductase subunit N n=1 Tax=Sphingomonas jatrophae TaxID=1166337 RepID=A0A1I6JVH4_9SPHN|nr:NADH-quinone oxidoreductase subunit NuoN [Sphingomonas jatrophae]SFR82888.1 NADH dehydrogenase subunit N [Sphingomonas jatrophae]